MAAINMNLNMLPEDIKSMTEYLYHCFDLSDYKKMAETIITYNIPYSEITSGNKTKYILSNTLSDLFSLLNFKTTKKVTKKVEEEILKYLIIKVD